MSFKDFGQQTISQVTQGMSQVSKWLKNSKQRTSNNLVALDISPDSLKLLRINSTEKQNRIENFSVSALPAGVFVKDEIKNPAAIVTTLREMFKDSGVTTKNVAFAIPRSSAIIKSIILDKSLNAEEIESRAWIEANRLFPDLVGDIYLDFTITGPAPQDAAKIELIIVACRKDQIEPYLDVLRQAGLTAKIVDVNCYALERAIPLVEPTITTAEVVGLLNLNKNLSTFVVVHQQKLIHAHDQSYNGERLLTQTENYLKDKTITQDEDLLGDAAYNEILKENLISHLRHNIHFFYSSRSNMTINKMILAGDCAKVPGLAAFIQHEIGVPTLVANPFANMQMPANVDKNEIAKFAPAMMLCCGLALNE